MTDGTDGCYLTPEFVLFLWPNDPARLIDWNTLFDVLSPGRIIGRLNMQGLFGERVAGMSEENFTFIMQAYVKANCERPQALSYAERMALARVCRRIIREAQSADHR